MGRHSILHHEPAPASGSRTPWTSKRQCLFLSVRQTLADAPAASAPTSRTTRGNSRQHATRGSPGSLHAHWELRRPPALSLCFVQVLLFAYRFENEIHLGTYVFFFVVPRSGARRIPLLVCARGQSKRTRGGGCSRPSIPRTGNTTRAAGGCCSLLQRRRRYARVRRHEAGPRSARWP